MLWANQKKTCVKENEDLRPIENLPTRAGETKARGWNGEWIDVIVNDPEAIWPVQAPAATRVTAAISNEPISIHELHLLGNIVISIISNIQRSTSDIQVGVCVCCTCVSLDISSGRPSFVGSVHYSSEAVAFQCAGPGKFFFGLRAGCSFKDKLSSYPCWHGRSQHLTKKSSRFVPLRFLFSWVHGQKGALFLEKKLNAFLWCWLPKDVFVLFGHSDNNKVGFPKMREGACDPPPFIPWQQDPIYVVVGLVQSPNKGRTETEMSWGGGFLENFSWIIWLSKFLLVCITREGSLTRYIVLELELPFPDAGMWSAGRCLGPSPRRLRPFTAFFFFLLSGLLKIASTPLLCTCVHVLSANNHKITQVKKDEKWASCHEIPTDFVVSVGAFGGGK